MINHNKKEITAWWSIKPDPGNFGDIMTPYFVKKLCGYKAVWTAIPVIKTALLSVGSTISKANYLTTVWGTGAMSALDRPTHYATYLAVRGPITRDLVLKYGGKCPAVFGDPGLLLPKFYNPEISKKYDIGFVPHYVDYEQVKSWYGDDPKVKIINLLDSDIHNVVDQMKQCKQLVSSSLHGVIVASAYGIPVTWAKLSDKLVGDGTKFQDFFQSVRVTHNKTDIFEKPAAFDDWYKLPYIKTIDIDLQPLIDAFPVKI